MTEVAPSTSGSDGQADERLAACFNCKRSKLKCVRHGGNATCTRCRQRRIDCAAPAYHVGRHKGVKNKHSGLEKAVYQIEQALRRSSSASDQIQNAEQATELRYLLDRSRELLGNRAHTGPPHTNSQQQQSTSIEQDLGPSPHQSSTSSLETPRSHTDQGSSRKVEDDQLNLDDAENPLQLLARTSELLSSITAQPQGSGPSRFPLGNSVSRAASNDNDLQKFFGRFQARLDVGDDLDPIDLGLLTLAEAEALFAYFYEKLAHTRWGIDPIIHTVDFVRSRSAFLFTSIAAASALFSPSLEALYKRLSNHRQKLAGLIMANRYKSVEIILAFMVNIPWISAGEHWADDATSTYISMALTVALDLSLNKIIISETPDVRMLDSIASSDCISARRALTIDGFPDVDPDSLTGRRLLRRRERTWLSLYVLERGICLARGRDPILPMTPLIMTCDQWHLSELADRWDGSIVSVAVLRRDLANLISRVRSICDAHDGSDETSFDSLVVERLKNEITLFFDRWYQTWPFQIGDREQLALPPYVEILASHTRLSMYSSVINHGTAPAAARQFFRAAGLSAALNVLRVAVQGEGQLKTMPNNTAIMISFAACFALHISTTADAGRDSTLAPSIRTLIAETTETLERIGSTPVQRKGLSCLFARQLQHILKLAARSSDHSRHPETVASSSGMAARESDILPANVKPDMSGGGVAPMASNSNAAAGPVMDMTAAAAAGGGSSMPPDYLMFSTMSNNELDEVIINTDVGMETLWDDFQFHNSDLDWMDWKTFA
ncbi:hypothetical protein PG993_003615 [Apiospora rasikravindrae]|uniref:Zn(2)-C6 fungal-type domain-containing protein n=1 Tax=Apiospora rasikravindrae TaxID=990691 RepID=A0ABR1U004_9PEZI